MPLAKDESHLWGHVNEWLTLRWRRDMYNAAPEVPRTTPGARGVVETFDANAQLLSLNIVALSAGNDFLQRAEDFELNRAQLLVLPPQP